MTDGRHFENGFNAVSARNHPISIKFGVQPQITLPRTVSHDKVPQVCKLKMADGHRIENRFSAISQRFIV